MKSSALNRLVKKIGADKLLHFSFSWAITLTACLFLGWWGIVIGVVAGVAKEIYDQVSYGGWSWGDLLAVGIGIALSVLIYWVRT